MPKALYLEHAVLPTKATKRNINAIVNSIMATDKLSVVAYEQGDLGMAEHYASLAYQLDALIAALPDNSTAFEAINAVEEA